MWKREIVDDCKLDISLIVINILKVHKSIFITLSCNSIYVSFSLFAMKYMTFRATFAIQKSQMFTNLYYFCSIKRKGTQQKAHKPNF